MDSPPQNPPTPQAIGSHAAAAKPPRRKRVLIAYNHSELSLLAEAPEPTAEAVRELSALLSARDFEVLAVNAEDDCDRLGDAVVVFRPDIILNLIDHFHGETMMAGAAVGLLSIFEYPYTGGDLHCVSSCQDRLKNRLMLASSGVRVPPFRALWSRSDEGGAGGLRFPVIVSQSVDDIYHRSDERPLLEGEEELRAFTRETLVDYEPPLLIEEYIGYQKMSVIVIADSVALAPCEVWRNEDDEWQVAIAELTDEQRETIGDIAREASAVLGCRDWSQVEIAINEGGDVFVTDVRPLVTPWNPDSPFRVAAADHPAGASGVLGLVIDCALARAARAAILEAAVLAELEQGEIEDEPDAAPPAASNPVELAEGGSNENDSKDNDSKDNNDNNDNNDNGDNGDNSPTEANNGPTENDNGPTEADPS